MYKEKKHKMVKICKKRDIKTKTGKHTSENSVFTTQEVPFLCTDDLIDISFTLLSTAI